MVYCRTINVERIAVHPMDNLRNTQFIELTKYGDEPTFSVWVDTGTSEEWFWEFDMSNPSDYERVKHNIFDIMFECDTMTELAIELDELFNDGFETILIKDECEECIGCDGCKYLS